MIQKEALQLLFQAQTTNTILHLRLEKMVTEFSQKETLTLQDKERIRCIVEALKNSLESSLPRKSNIEDPGWGPI